MKAKTILSVILFLLAIVAYSQERIERLFPLLGKCDGITVFEDLGYYETDTISERDYSVILMPTEIDCLPPQLKDSLISAFEKEIVVASESDRYHRNKDGEDTLIYNLIYSGEINLNSEAAKTNHNYTTDTHIAARLDVINGKLTFSYIREGYPQYRVWPREIIDDTSNSLQRYDAEGLTKIFNEIAENKSISKKAIVFDGYKNTSGYCLFQTNKYTRSSSKGTRLEVPPSLAEETYKKMADAINMITVTNQCFSFSQGKNEIDIIFGKDWQKDAFLLHRAADERVFIFHKEQQEEGCDNYIPQNWYSEDYVEQ